VVRRAKNWSTYLHDQDCALSTLCFTTTMPCTVVQIYIILIILYSKTINLDD